MYLGIDSNLYSDMLCLWFITNVYNQEPLRDVYAIYKNMIFTAVETNRRTRVDQKVIRLASQLRSKNPLPNDNS